MVEILRKDGAYFVGDGYTLLNNTWGRRDLVNGDDYVQTITHGLAVEGVAFAWDWPIAEPRHVLAYPQVFVGRSPWSGIGAEGDLPMRLSAIDSLTVAYDLDWGGASQFFNVAFDLWLSTDPSGGRDAISHEVMIWLKTADFSPGGRVVDSVAIGDFTADFHFKEATPLGWPQWTYAAFRSHEEIKAGRIDIAALLDHLVAEGVATSDLWLMDVELGAEIIGGAGWFRIDGFEVSLNAALKGAGSQTMAAMPARLDDGSQGIDPGALTLVDIAF